MKVALIGVGFMGRGMARNIMMKGPKGTHLLLYDIKFQNPDFKAELMQEFNDISGGGNILTIANTPREAANAADIIALSLPSADITENVLFGKDGVISVGNNSISPSDRKKVIMEHGTFSRDFVMKCKRRSSSARFDYIDAPVSGGPGGAQQGSLTFMVGGEPSVVTAATPLLQLYGSNIYHFGDVGSGMAAKLVNQALVVMHANAAAEAVYLAKQFGLEDMAALHAMLGNSWGQSKILDLALTDLIAVQHDDDKIAALKRSKAPLRNLLKDMDCIDADIRAMHKDQPMQLKMISQAHAAIKDACSHGLQDAAFIALADQIGRNSPLS